MKYTHAFPLCKGNRQIRPLLPFSRDVVSHFITTEAVRVIAFCLNECTIGESPWVSSWSRVYKMPFFFFALLTAFVSQQILANPFNPGYKCCKSSICFFVLTKFATFAILALQKNAFNWTYLSIQIEIFLSSFAFTRFQGEKCKSPEVWPDMEHTWQTCAISAAPQQQS